MKNIKILSIMILVALAGVLTYSIGFGSDPKVNQVHYISVKKIPAPQTLTMSMFSEIEVEKASISEVKTGLEDIVVKEEVKKSRFSQKEIDLLTQAVHAEAGSSWLSDEHQILVATVILNRVESEYFPNTIKGVIYQKGQYSGIDGPQWNVEPQERTKENVLKAIASFEANKYPRNLLFQAEFKQGSSVYVKVLNSKTKNYTYFCLK